MYGYFVAFSMGLFITLYLFEIHVVTHVVVYALLWLLRSSIYLHIALVGILLSVVKASRGASEASSSLARVPVTTSVVATYAVKEGVEVTKSAFCLATLTLYTSCLTIQSPEYE